MTTTRTHYLYRITNTVNSKIYIGVSINPSQRFKDHCIERKLIGKAIKKYGKENFTLETLVAGERAYIYDLEINAIAALNSMVPNGYNVSVGGIGGQAGTSVSAETRAKLSAAMKGKKRAPKSAETRAKISEARQKRERDRQDAARL